MRLVHDVVSASAVILLAISADAQSEGELEAIAWIYSVR